MSSGKCLLNYSVHYLFHWRLCLLLSHRNSICILHKSLLSCISLVFCQSVDCIFSIFKLFNRVHLRTEICKFDEIRLRYFLRSVVVSAFTLSFMTHVELIFVNGVRSGLRFIKKKKGYLVVLAPLLRKLSFPTQLYFYLCQKLIGYIWMDLFLHSLFCTSDPYI